jgi:hypothetical protein
MIFGWIKDIPYSHFCEYPGPTTYKHTRFPNPGRDINKRVDRGYQFRIGQFLTAQESDKLLPIVN